MASFTTYEVIMAAPQSFAFYPDPIDWTQSEASIEDGTGREDSNPVMRGWSLVIGASLYVFVLTSQEERNQKRLT